MSNERKAGQCVIESERERESVRKECGRRTEREEQHATVPASRRSASRSSPCGGSAAWTLTKSD